MLSRFPWLDPKWPSNPPSPQLRLELVVARAAVPALRRSTPDFLSAIEAGHVQRPVLQLLPAAPLEGALQPAHPGILLAVRCWWTSLGDMPVVVHPGEALSKFSAENCWGEQQSALIRVAFPHGDRRQSSSHTTSGGHGSGIQSWSTAKLWKIRISTDSKHSSNHDHYQPVWTCSIEHSHDESLLISHFQPSLRYIG